jgi:hypothetical protein
MNVYQKLNAARQRLHSMQLKKSGYNSFAKYSYFELGDFLIPSLGIFNELGLCATISFGTDVATMRVINIDKPDEVIEFTSPMAPAELKGCHPIQNLGAVETYTRRYLWVAAMEIVEHDAIDSSEPIKTDKTIKPAKHSPVEDVVLDDDSAARVQEIVTDMVIAFDAGRELEVIELAAMLTDSEEKIYAWKLLAPHSKIRALIKANKPKAEEMA